MTCTATPTICKHKDANKTFYVDWTAELAQRSGVAISSGTVTFTADATITVGSVTVTAAQVTDVDADGNDITIAAGKALQFSLSGGTSIADTDDPIEGTCTVTYDDGDVDARILKLRVDG